MYMVQLEEAQGSYVRWVLLSWYSSIGQCGGIHKEKELHNSPLWTPSYQTQHQFHCIQKITFFLCSLSHSHRVSFCPFFFCHQLCFIFVFLLLSLIRLWHPVFSHIFCFPLYSFADEGPGPKTFRILVLNVALSFGNTRISKINSTETQEDILFCLFQNSLFTHVKTFMLSKRFVCKIFKTSKSSKVFICCKTCKTNQKLQSALIYKLCFVFHMGFTSFAYVSQHD